MPAELAIGRSDDEDVGHGPGRVGAAGILRPTAAPLDLQPGRSGRCVTDIASGAVLRLPAGRTSSRRRDLGHPPLHRTFEGVEHGHAGPRHVQAPLHRTFEGVRDRDGCSVGGRRRPSRPPEFGPPVGATDAPMVTETASDAAIRLLLMAMTMLPSW